MIGPNALRRKLRPVVMDESLLWPVGISGLQPDKNRCCVNKCITAFSHGLRNEYLRSEGEAWPSERLLLRRILQTCSGSLDTTKGVVQIRKAGNFHASVSLRSRPVNPFFRCGRPASAPCPWRTSRPSGGHCNSPHHRSLLSCDNTITNARHVRPLVIAHCRHRAYPSCYLPTVSQDVLCLWSSILSLCDKSSTFHSFLHHIALLIAISSWRRDARMFPLQLLSLLSLPSSYCLLLSDNLSLYNWTNSLLSRNARRSCFCSMSIVSR